MIIDSKRASRISLMFAGIGMMIICMISSSCLAVDSKILTQESLNLYRTDSIKKEKVFHLPKGLYLVTETLCLPSNSTLHGDGPDTVLKVAPDFRGGQFISNADLLRGNNDITLSSFKVEFDIKKLPGNLPGVLRFENVKNLKITDITIEADTKYYCIDLSAGINNATVNRCIIRNRGLGGAIQVRNRYPEASRAVKNIRLSGNKVTSVGDEPIAVFGWLGDVSDVLIENNIVTANEASFGITAYGIDNPAHTGRLSYVTISNNNISGSRNGAIAAKGGVSNVNIKNNQVAKTVNDGIFIDNGGLGLPPAQKINITGNRVADAGRHGIYAKGFDIRIDSNVISRCKGVGIFVASNDPAHFDVLNNTITEVPKSILVSGPATGLMEGNILQKQNEIRYLK